MCHPYVKHWVLNNFNQLPTGYCVHCHLLLKLSPFRVAPLSMAAEAAAVGSHPQIVLCPFHAVGHVTPMMILAKKLARLGISAKVLIAGRWLYDAITKNGHDPTEGLDIVLEVLEIGDVEGGELSLRSTGTGVRMLQRGQPKERISMFIKHGRALGRKLRAIASSESPPICALIDYTLLPSNKFFVEKNHKLPIYLFSPFPTVHLVTHLAVVEQLARIGNSGLVIPGLPHFHPRDIPDYFKKTFDGLFYLTRQYCKLLQKFDRIVINTFDELESAPLHLLHHHFSKSFGSTVYGVGPLLPASHFGDDRATAEATVFKSAQEELYKQWLDAQLPASVLYICFGSWISFSAQQIHELALGLEASKHKFLWVLPTPAESAALPEDFKDRTENQGLVAVGWAPQNLILGHPSTGGFATVCGWNSVLECLSLAGIPMLAGPMFSDHLPTCRYLVDGLKIAVEVLGDDSAGGLVRREEVETVVKKLMAGDEAVAMRSRAMSLKGAACEAGKASGSLRAFVQDVVKINEEMEEERLLRGESLRGKAIEMLRSCFRLFF